MRRLNKVSNTVELIRQHTRSPRNTSIINARKTALIYFKLISLPQENNLKDKKKCVPKNEKKTLYPVLLIDATYQSVRSKLDVGPLLHKGVY